MFFGQRQLIFLGEQLVRNGLKGWLDNTTRLSEASIRSDLFVIQGSDAIDALKMGGTLEPLPVVGALKKHERSGGRGETTLLDFLIAANRSGIHPTLPAAKLSQSKHMKPEKFFELSGVAILDEELKLAGFMDMEEDRDLLWLLNKLRKITLEADMDGGNVSAGFINLRSSIKPSRKKDGTWHFDITLHGDGDLLENNTEMDAGNKQVLNKFELALEQAVAKHMLATIHKVQDEFGLDIFGFGVVVHRKFPKLWPGLKDRWDEEFRRSTFRIEADLNLERPGLTGIPLL